MMPNYTQNVYSFSVIAVRWRNKLNVMNMHDIFRIFTFLPDLLPSFIGVSVNLFSQLYIYSKV